MSHVLVVPRSLRGGLAAAAALFGVAGCGAGYFVSPPLPPPADAVAYHSSPVATTSGNGGIFDSDHAVSLFENPRARHVGDIVTIRLQEAFNASKTASTQTQKDGSTSLPSPVIAGKQPLAGDTTLDAKRAFKGQGTSSQQNALTGSITAVIVEVLPSGNMVISGERVLQLNQGEEFVRVKGVVRALDLQSDNSVTSDRIADARISYSGRGVLDATNRMGWLSRFFNSPITPF
jgi:flagellar L-ring protein precursor FlgH